MKKIGFIGIGTMGLPMASNIINKGYSLSFYDPFVNSESVNTLEKLGGIQKSSLSELSQDVEIIITMLPNGDNVKEVCFGKNGLIYQDNKNFVLIDMSTINPNDSIFINEELNKNNIKMFDAPVARLVQNAIDGTLLIMVGGNKDEFKNIKNLLETMGSDIVYCGENGSGSKMKIINNYMSIALNILTAETLNLADKSGIDKKMAIELMLTTAAGKGHMNLTYPAKVFKDDVSPGFKNNLALKDLRLAIQFASEQRLDLNMGKAAEKIYDDASKKEFGDLDWTSMFNFIKNK